MQRGKARFLFVSFRPWFVSVITLLLTITSCATIPPLVEVPSGKVSTIPATGKTGDEPFMDSTLVPRPGVQTMAFFADGTRVLVASTFSGDPLRQVRGQQNYRRFQGVVVEIIDTSTGEVLQQSVFSGLGSSGPAIRLGSSVFISIGEHFVVNVDDSLPNELVVTETSTDNQPTLLSVTNQPHQLSSDGQKAIKITNGGLEVYQNPTDGLGEASLETTVKVDTTTNWNTPATIVESGWFGDSNTVFVVVQGGGVAELRSYNLSTPDRPGILLSRQELSRRGLNDFSMLKVDQKSGIGFAVLRPSTIEDGYQLWSIDISDSNEFIIQDSVRLGPLRFPNAAVFPGTNGRFVAFAFGTGTRAWTELWSIDPFMPVLRINGSTTSRITSLAINDESDLLAIGYQNGTLDLWNLVEDRAVVTIDTSQPQEFLPELPSPQMLTPGVVNLSREVTIH